MAPSGIGTSTSRSTATPFLADGRRQTRPTTWLMKLIAAFSDLVRPRANPLAAAPVLHSTANHGGPPSRRQARGVIRPTSRWMAVARGDEPADVVVAGGKVLSVFTREWLDADVAIVDGHVVGVASGYQGVERIDAAGAWVAPGLIDAHMHIESSKRMVDEFARAVLPHGTTAVVADPHELANVLGVEGVHWLLDATENLPLDVFVMASSCVPASEFESPRGPVTVEQMGELLRRDRVLGVAEMMNFPGVIAGSPA